METTSNLPVDRGWAWVIVFSHFMNLFFMVGTAKSIGILFQEFHQHFNVPMAIVTLVMSVTGIIYSLFSPLSILFGEQFTARRIVMLGGIIGAIGISLSCLLFNIGYVIIFFGIGFGVGNATIYGNGLILLGHYFKKRRSLANGMALAGSSIGQFVLPPVIQFFLETYGLGGTVLLLGGLYFHVTLFGSLFRPTSFYDKPKPTDESDKFIDSFELSKYENGILERNGVIGSVDSLNNYSDLSLIKERKLEAILASTGSLYLGSAGSLKDIFDDPDSSRIYNDKPSQKLKMVDVFKSMFNFSIMKNYLCLLYLIVSFLGFMGHFNFVLFLPAYALDRGITKYDKAMLVSICGICDLFGRLFFGFLGDLDKIERYKLKGICLMCVGINTVMFAFANTYPWIAVHAAIYGVFGGGFIGLMAVVLIDLVGMELMPKALAVVLLFQGVGAATGQPFLGWLRDYSGTYNPVVYVCSVCCFLAGLFLMFTPAVRSLEKKRQARLGTTENQQMNEYIVPQES